VSGALGSKSRTVTKSAHRTFRTVPETVVFGRLCECGEWRLGALLDVLLLRRECQLMRKRKS
jgi:hypothetical protein